MLPELKNDLKYLLSILQSIGKIKYYTRNISTPEELIEEDEQLIYNACLTLFTNIGESVGKLSETSKACIDESVLKGTIGVRNRIAHDYSNVNTFIIYEIIESQLYNLQQTIENILIRGLKSNDFDMEEFYAAKKSGYYKFVKFENVE